MEDRIQYGMHLPRPRGYKNPTPWTGPENHDRLLTSITEYSLTHGHLVKIKNSFYYIDHIMKEVHLQKIALWCPVQGCGYYIGDYKELFRHLRKVHNYRLLKLPGALVNSIEKSKKPMPPDSPK